MRNRGIGVRLAASIALASLAVGSAYAHENPFCPKLRYEVIDLGTFGAGDGGAGFINNRGELSGTISVSDDVGRAFFWDCAHGIQNIGALDETDFASISYALNDRGQVLVQSSSFDRGAVAIWDRANGMRLVVESGFPQSLNDLGDITYFGDGGVWLWNERTGGVLLPEVTGIDFREAFVNNRREVAGVGRRSDPTGDPTITQQYYFWSRARGTRALGKLPSEAFDFTTEAFTGRGDVLGNAFIDRANPKIIAFFIDRKGTVHFINDPATRSAAARDINNRRQAIVGSNGEQFIWDPKNGFATSVTALVGDQRLNGVSDINEWGWLAGSTSAGSGSSDPPQVRPALVVPVPANDPFYEDLGRLRGKPLCRALDSLRVRAIVLELICP